MIFIAYVLSCSVSSTLLRPHGLKPTRFLCPWKFPSKNTGVGCHFLLWGILQGGDQTCISLHLLHGKVGSSPVCHLGSPMIFMSRHLLSECMPGSGLGAAVSCCMHTHTHTHKMREKSYYCSHFSVNIFRGSEGFNNFPENRWKGLPSWFSGWDFILPELGVPVLSPVKELGPTCLNWEFTCCNKDWTSRVPQLRPREAKWINIFSKKKRTWGDSQYWTTGNLTFNSQALTHWTKHHLELAASTSHLKFFQELSQSSW